MDTDSYGNTTEESVSFGPNTTNTTGDRPRFDLSDIMCYRQVGFAVNSVAAGMVCLLGLAGNSVSYFVLTRDKGAPVASFLLKSLALVDNAFLVIWFMQFSLHDMFLYFKLSKHFHVAWLYFRVINYPLTFVAQTGTIYVTVLIAATRYLAVCKPYMSVTWGSLRNVKLGMISVVIFSVLYNLPRFFENKIVMMDVKGVMKPRIRRTWLGNDPSYGLIYFDVMYYIFSFGLPLLLLAVLNTKLTIAYRIVRMKRRESLQVRSERENADQNITLVMIIVVLVFMLCNAPARLGQFFWSYERVKCMSFGFWIMKISTVMEVFNSSINFVIYCVFRKQFREVLRQQCCGNGRRRSQARHEQPRRLTNGDMRTLDTSFAAGIVEDSTRV